MNHDIWVFVSGLLIGGGLVITVVSLALQGGVRGWWGHRPWRKHPKCPVCL